MESHLSPSNSLDSSKTVDDDETASWMSSFCSADLFDTDSSDDSNSSFDASYINNNNNNYGYYWQSSYYFDFNPTPLPTYVGAGLENLGNTCFLNAVLQCFMYTVPLLQGFVSGLLRSANCYCRSGGFCLLCALRELLHLCLISSNRVVPPYKLVQNLSYFSSSFQRFHQEDAHEFLQSFLDRLESCCEVKSCDNSSSQSDNLVKQVFGGRLVSKLKCSNCGHCSDTYEPLIDLSLEIDDADNLLSALQSFTKVEKIEDADTKFTCEGCKEQVFVEKQLALDQIPAVASFHLKRFKNDGCFVEKIDKHVAFPYELDLLPFTGNGNTVDAELKYILYAVVVHSGFTPTSGHYYSMVRLSQDMWCKFNDSRVSVVTEDFVLKQEAYILFYAKEGTPWFSSWIETQNSCPSSKILSTSPKSVLDNVDTSSYSSDIQEKTSIDTNTMSDLSGSRHLRVGNDEIKDSGTKLNENVETSSYSSDLQEKTSIDTNTVIALSGSEHLIIGNNEINDGGTKLNENVETSSYSSDLQEKTSIDTNTVNALSGSRHLRIGKDEIKDGGTKLSEINCNEYNDRICNLVEPDNVSPDVSLKEDQKVCSPILLDKTTWTRGTDAVGDINPQVSLKSPSPELIREEPPAFSIPHNNQKLVDHVSCKRKFEKEMDGDKGTRQAFQIIKKYTPGARKRKQLLAALRGAKSEGHANIPKSRKKRPLATVRGSNSEGRANKKSSAGLPQSIKDRNTPTKPSLSVGDRLVRSSLVIGRTG